MGETQRLMGKITNEALQAALFTEIIHTQHIATVRDHVAQGGKALVVGNHIGAMDPVAHAKVLGEITTPDHIIAVGSRRHFDPKQGRYNAVKGLLREWWQEAYGIDIALVVQKKDRADYPDWREYNARTQARLEKAINRPGQLVYMLPEGTRSTEGGLLRAGVGISGLLREGGDDVLVLPITEAYTDLRLLRGRARLTIGEPFFRPQIMTEKAAINQRITELGQQETRTPFADVADVVMLHIAQPLNPENYGEYAQLMEISNGLIAA
ncbi:MAG: hypothetical protein ACD_37C00576G0003 [uncultured bacterium]|nr:MAG: hypothetical protein ACD_37C00576G0003 [uncultured bacterium]